MAPKLINPAGLFSQPHPTENYIDAVQRIETLLAKDTAQINPVCAAEFMTHGHQTGRAIAFIHGFTNCPRQFHPLGRHFFERGYNVLLARMPYHGYRDRLATDFAKLKAEALAALTDELVDIGRGLGQHFTLGGISGGGVASAWAYQFRSDLDQALVIAPSFGVTYVPRSLNAGVTWLMRIIPNIFLWWDTKLKTDSKPDYAYPRFATRALGEIMRLGYAVRDAAAGARPAGRRAALVTVGGDKAVDNLVADQLADAWQAHAGQVIRHEFPADIKLPHDLIDPNQPDQQVDLVYPKLIELAETP